MSTPDSPMLSAAQLETLAGLGEERSADVGDVLYRAGDKQYPFIAILEGEARSSTTSATRSPALVRRSSSAS